MGMVKVIDNFLPKHEFEIISELVVSNEFPWYFVNNINAEYKEKNFESYLIHHIFDRNSGYSKHSDPFRKILIRLNAKCFIRVKANMYPRTQKLEIHKTHIDYPYKHKAAIFYINTNNGKTILHDGKEIDSVANRLLLFDSHKPHSSTSTTNAKCRLNVNINYF